jgi:quercetin dioxygenase-like cupin family protein
MRRLSVVSAAMALVAVGAIVRAQEDAMPVYHEPHHRQVFHASPTRILDGRIPPGDISLYHTHDHPILYVTFSSSQTKTETIGQENPAPAAGRGGGRGRGPLPPPPGISGLRMNSTTSYVERPITHRIANVGERTFQFMAVVNESAGNDAQSPGEAGFTGDPEVTNKWFRGYRIVLAPGESTPKHRHTMPAVLIQTTDGTAVASGAIKWELDEPTRWAWFEAGDAHDIRNVGSKPMEIVEVEVRR